MSGFPAPILFISGSKTRTVNVGIRVPGSFEFAFHRRGSLWKRSLHDGARIRLVLILVF